MFIPLVQDLQHTTTVQIDNGTTSRVKINSSIRISSRSKAAELRHELAIEPLALLPESQRCEAHGQEPAGTLAYSITSAATSSATSGSAVAT